MRFFFHLRERGGYIVDEEGVELPGPDAARKAALAAARSIIAGEALAGRIPLNATIEVVDEAGNLLIELPFREAVVLES